MELEQNHRQGILENIILDMEWKIEDLIPADLHIWVKLELELAEMVEISPTYDLSIKDLYK